MSGKCDHLDQETGCRLGVWQGVPPEQICARCPHYEGPPRGLGDKVHDLARTSGIKAAVDAAHRLVGRDCGCQKRREALNRRYPSETP